MKDTVDKCSTKGCAIDVGSIIDNDDCTAIVERIYASSDEAESSMSRIRQLISAAASEEDASVKYHIQTLEGNAVKLHVAATFACQAESLIFQLSLRSLV